MGSKKEFTPKIHQEDWIWPSELTNTSGDETGTEE